MTNDNIITQEMWDSLNEELWDRRTEMTEMKIVIAKLRRERDEARREVLEGMHPDLRHGYAAAREWDCFKENTNE